MAMVLTKKEIKAIQEVLNEKFKCGLAVTGGMDNATMNALKVYVGAGANALFPPSSVDSIHPSIRNAVKEKLAGKPVQAKPVEKPVAVEVQKPAETASAPAVEAKEVKETKTATSKMKPLIPVEE